MNTEGKALKDWVDWKTPIHRIGFGISMWLAVSLDQGLMSYLRTANLHGRPGPLIACILFALFDVGLMWNLTVKRLTDIGWPRSLSFLIIGPILANLPMFVGLGKKDLSTLSKVAITAPFVAYGILAILLIAYPPRSPSGSE